MEIDLRKTCLLVNGIELIGFHGYAEEERQKGNHYRIDLKIEGEIEQALTTDRLEDSIDYSQMVRTVREINRARKCFLIESFADGIANGLLERFPRIRKITVRVAKLDPPGLGRVMCAAIEVTKERK